MKFRYERKYLVRNEQIDALRKRLDPFLRPDHYAPKLESGLHQYTVRSVYLDTIHFDALLDKIEGLEIRKKLRVRGYDRPNDGCKVFLEIKRKLGDRIWKNRASVAYKDLGELFTFGLSNGLGKNFEGQNEEETRKFLFNLHRYGYRPVNLVTYDREPFHGKFDPGVRITFDKNIRSKLWPSFEQLYSESGLRLVWKDHFILEIKYFEDKMPVWARSIVQEFGLRHEALSKYATPFSKTDVSIYNQRMI